MIKSCVHEQECICDLWDDGLKSHGASRFDCGLLCRSHFLLQIHVISHATMGKIMQPPLTSDF